MSPKGNHMIAIKNGTEDYELLKTSLSDVVEEIKTLSSITINDVTFPIEYYLCGDRQLYVELKVLQQNIHVCGAHVLHQSDTT